MELESDDVFLGRVGYEAYGESVGWRAFSGDAMPSWSALPDRIRDAWIAAGVAIDQHAVSKREARQ